MRITIVTNYAVIAYDVITDMTKEEVIEALDNESVSFDTKEGNVVMINAMNAIAVEIKDTPHTK